MGGLLRNTHLLLGGRPRLSAGVLAPLRRCEEKNEEKEGRNGSLTLSPWRDRASSLLFDSVERRVREFWANDGPYYQAEIILQLSSKDDFWLGKSAFP